MGNEVIAIASDHAGFDLKAYIIESLSKDGYKLEDMGTYSGASTDYPDWGHKLGRAVDRQEYQLGIAICGSGNGISMVLNKYEGVRSALCWTEEIAALARSHNDANVCTLPARFISKEQSIKILNKFLNTSFEGGRHEARVKKIAIKNQ
ncbi:MAG: RpiB/LacA/LacB family sugar-phosphate isomerase [Bacteroidales bacterium]